MNIVNLLFLALTSSTLLSARAVNPTCGAPEDAFVYEVNDVCLCSVGTAEANATEDTLTVYISTIFDSTNFPWVKELVDFTVMLLNNKTDGFHDDIFADGTTIEMDLRNGGCNESIAFEAYWDSRIASNGRPVHGVVGARCSGESIAIGRLSGREGIPQISPVSTSFRLSNKVEYPLFSRLAGPDAAEGGVGAIIALLREFHWDRVSILSTDSQFSKDISDEFRKSWEKEHDGMGWTGEIAYSSTISYNATGKVDENSVRQSIQALDNLAWKSNVIVLAALEQDAFQLLSQVMNQFPSFQKDKTWVALHWAGQEPNSTDWLNGIEYPGYIGVAPGWNEYAPAFKDFLGLLQQYQVSQGRKVWEKLETYSQVYLVDAIVSLARALSLVPVEERHNGTLVSDVLRSNSFEGVTGRVSFAPNGDRNDPLYAIYNFQKRGENKYEWVNIGSTGTSEASLNFTSDNICFTKSGCTTSAEAPKDSGPKPGNSGTPVWVYVIVPIISTLLVGLAFKYWRSRKRKKQTLSQLEEAMRKIDAQLLDVDKDVSTANKKRRDLILARGALMEKPDTWSETDDGLVEVNAVDDQYWTVVDQLHLTMGDAHISKLWRIQNLPLWSYYSFHKDRLTMAGMETNEGKVWHGTSDLDPMMIYNDRQDGFMMQFSRDGFWGRGIYFAEKSSYSNAYAYKPANRSASSVGSDGRSIGENDEREMFLAKLLKGNEVLMDRDESPQKAQQCRVLTVPPFMPGTHLKYNTVTGYTAGSQVWIVYENGRAYPDYLIRYYRGERDPNRTPYASKKDAQMVPEDASVRISDTSSDSLDLECGEAAATEPVAGMIWEFSDNSGWKEYSPLHQTILENTYNAFQAKKDLRTIKIKSDEWSYEIDFIAMTQTNIDHPNHKRRTIRRREYKGGMSSPQRLSV